MKNDFGIILLRQINGLLGFYHNHRLEKISGLTFSQIFLLYEMFDMADQEKRGFSLSALAAETGFSKSTVCATLRALKEAGYIKMNADRMDHRRKKIFLTQKAEAAREEVNDFVKEVNTSLRQGITDQEMEVLEYSLQKILENIRITRARCLDLE
ncbi:winged helix-turn-helix transcriptional regulator [Anaerotignum lactatifermentans]|uniref:Winged helix-turn-helix transcriptional regulator n=1 Tax=Anaerotignum lactatifermentans TaxID=160404 RepID=A0ABS2G6B6_9FIRM|nr:MarR family winged helix-turn-helix transcriptional regulator [Anaerotignum lactatifermentans]MBM6828826.1 winged helix-turn-helix transcriptional regulator [Anaerotignum lactatifermentans]MBM6877001.1 winged helix-turn-helix transcriptional regulator [Anaerotignum lactatifermentans]MBM6950559.1 winged helix-turn-helix transcriptional regulator [Anaerotignum lactatifermentans]